MAKAAKGKRRSKTLAARRAQRGHRVIVAAGIIGGNIGGNLLLGPAGGIAGGIAGGVAANRYYMSKRG